MTEYTAQSMSLGDRAEHANTSAPFQSDYAKSENPQSSSRVLSWVKSGWLQGAVLYGVSFVILSIIIFATPGFLGNDDYYHARMAAQIFDQGRLALQFPWLPDTILDAQHFVDHHLLFHLYVAPWMHWGGMAGAKLAVVSIAAAIWVAVWLFFRQIQVNYAFLWTVALFGVSNPFLYRMLMIRTQGASLLLLVIALTILFSKRQRWLIVVAFAYTWLYDGFGLMLIFALGYSVATWLAERRWEWKPVVYTAIGITAGLVINPYFPQNILFITDHLGAKVNFQSGIPVGNEWYPYDTDVLLSNSGGALLLLLVGFLPASFIGRRRDRVENTLLFVAIITLFMVLRSRRFIEYFPAFALLFSAAAWRRGSLQTTGLAFFSGKKGRVILTVLSMAALTFFAARTLNDTYKTAQNSTSIDYMAGAARWLQRNTPPGTLVFQTDWDDFTNLFYYNTSNHYLIGLDPTYLQLKNPIMWDEWVDITQGRISQPSRLIQAAFGATYVVSDTRHSNFEDRVRDDSHMQLVYRDQYSYIWRIVGYPS